MSESSIEVNGGQLQDFTIDQFAGASALILGSFGGLLMIIWKSRCACRVRLGLTDKCYLFDCERKPPDDDKDSDEESIIPPKVKKDSKDKDTGRVDKNDLENIQVNVDDTIDESA
tara:strand:+ start:93 stop:437 length:345 start_codon:yes stop_codon:yes gene_type:complete